MENDAFAEALCKEEYSAETHSIRKKRNVGRPRHPWKKRLTITIDERLEEKAREFADQNDITSLSALFSLSLKKYIDG